MHIKLLVFSALLWPAAVMADEPSELEYDWMDQLVDTVDKRDRQSKEEREAEIDEAAKEEERRQKEFLSRVVVIRWDKTETDYTDDNVRRDVRSRTGRPDALFFPEVDLYQNGRKVPDTTVIPANQPAIVQDVAPSSVLSAVDAAAQIPRGQLNASQWGEKAHELLKMADRLWFMDRVELREAMFLLYAQIGRVADNQDFPSPPFYEQVGPLPVNYYYYLAAQLAYQEPALLGRLTDPDQSASVQYLYSQIQGGYFSPLKLDFTEDNEFDLEAFNENYVVHLNGLPVDLDPRGQIDIFPGVTDIYLYRNDSGHGLSERLETIKLEEKIYFVRDVARKKMGVTFKDQLFYHRNECIPEVDGDILNYLAIYQKLHSKAEVFIAVPENGNPNKVWIWRYDPKAAQLIQVGGGPDGFPVRFVGLFSTGLVYNGASLSYDNEVTGDGATSVLLDGINGQVPVSANLDSGAWVFDFELRGHYNRLMVNMGFETGRPTSAASDGWVEYYQTPGQNRSESEDDVLNNGDLWTYETAGCNEVDSDQDGTVDTLQCDDELITALNTRNFNRHLYVGAGVVLGRDAALGFGPRIAAQFGWVNMPHSFQPTLHVGYGYQLPFGEFTGRVRPIVDADLRGGVAIARARSLQFDLKADEDVKDEGRVMPVYGINIGAGFTF